MPDCPAWLLPEAKTEWIRLSEKLNQMGVLTEIDRSAWIPDSILMKGNEKIDMAALEGRDCYAGLDLSSTGDIIALVLIFPPRDEDEKYILLPFFWVPEETIPQRVTVLQWFRSDRALQVYRLTSSAYIVAKSILLCECAI